MTFSKLNPEHFSVESHHSFHKQDDWRDRVKETHTESDQVNFVLGMPDFSPATLKGALPLGKDQPILPVPKSLSIMESRSLRRHRRL